MCLRSFVKASICAGTGCCKTNSELFYWCDIWCSDEIYEMVFVLN